MNLAEQLNESGTNSATDLQIDIETSNIISLSEQGLLLYSPHTHQLPDDFLGHIGSPLNEW